MALGTSFGYPVVSADELGLTGYFRENMDVAGLAWGGGLNGSSKDSPRVIVANPYNSEVVDPEKMQEFLKGEAAKHLMDETGYTPEFDISKEQQEWRKNLGDAAGDDLAVKRSIVSKVMVGDSVPGVTPEQQADATKFNSVLDKRENPSFVESIMSGLDSTLTGISMGLRKVQDTAQDVADYPADKAIGDRSNVFVNMLQGDNATRTTGQSSKTPVAVQQTAAPVKTPQKTSLDQNKMDSMLGDIDRVAQQIAKDNPQFDADLYTRSMRAQVQSQIDTSVAAGLDRSFIENDAKESIKSIVRQAPKMFSQYKKPDETINVTGRTPQQIYGMAGNAVVWDPWKTN